MGSGQAGDKKRFLVNLVFVRRSMEAGISGASYATTASEIATGSVVHY